MVLLRFNQPVQPAEVGAHLSARFEPHDWSPPSISPAVQQRLSAIDQTSLTRFNAKVAATSAAASSSAPVTLRLTNDWDKDRYPPANTLVVFETATRVPSQSWVKVTLDAALKSPAGPATPGHVQEYTMKAEPALFVWGFDCNAGCDPDARNPLYFHTPVRVSDFAKSLRLTNITTGAGTDLPKPDESTAPTTAPTTMWGRDSAEGLTLEDARHGAQPPATNYFVAIDAGLKSIDGQTLGYTWAGQVENWHRTAFTSFGDGHGVWEASGGSVLPFYAQQPVRREAVGGAPGDRRSDAGIRKLTPSFNLPPPVDPVDRKLNVTTDRIQSHGLDVAKALGATGTGLFGPPSKTARRSRTRSAPFSPCARPSCR